MAPTVCPIRRAISCFVSIFLAASVIFAIGGWRPAAKSLHEYYIGVLFIFLSSYFTIMFFISKRKLIESYLIIIVGAALAYPVSIFSYVTYFAVFENEMLVKAIKYLKFDAILTMMAFFPTVFLVWLFGGLVGAFILLLNRVGFLPYRKRCSSAI
jgi:hypothetical protein